MAGGKVVGAVQHHVGLRNQFAEQGLAGALHDGRDLHIGVDRSNRLDDGLGLGVAHPREVVGDLALQVGFVHHVVVHHRDAAHAGAAQVERHG